MYVTEKYIVRFKTQVAWIEQTWQECEKLSKVVDAIYVLEFLWANQHSVTFPAATYGRVGSYESCDSRFGL